MCVDKKEWGKFKDEVKESMGAFHHDLKGVRSSQDGVAVILKDMQEHLKRLNGRTAKVENKVENLEDPKRKEGYCIQKDEVKDIKENMLTVDRFERHVLQDREDRREERRQIIAQQEAHDRKQLMYIKVMGAIITAAAILVNLIPLVR